MSEKNILSQEEIDALLDFKEEADWIDFSDEKESVAITIYSKLSISELLPLESNDRLALSMAIDQCISIIVNGTVIARGQLKLDNNQQFFLQII